ncbi:hypothetical protein J6590_063873 [Homalodisca vitripennis]|nr:hypothetical protein J6590_063873 [Homalodisca vitripennis]
MPNHRPYDRLHSCLTVAAPPVLSGQSLPIFTIIEVGHKSKEDPFVRRIRDKILSGTTTATAFTKRIGTQDCTATANELYKGSSIPSTLYAPRGGSALCELTNNGACDAQNDCHDKTIAKGYKKGIETQSNTKSGIGLGTSLERNHHKNKEVSERVRTVTSDGRYDTHTNKYEKEGIETQYGTDLQKRDRCGELQYETATKTKYAFLVTATGPYLHY